jgi:nitrate/TMAO reductase-like tetraheme cytochrome c subunit
MNQMAIKGPIQLVDTVLAAFDYNCKECAVTPEVSMPTTRKESTSQTVKGQFINKELDKEKLQKAKEAAKVRIKRNKRLGDLLAQ